MPANPMPITVMEDMTIEAMPTVLKKCEWVNRRNSAMFVMTCYKIYLIRRTHTLTPVYGNTVWYLVPSTGCVISSVVGV